MLTRILQLLCGILILGLAAWLCIPAAFQAWQLVAHPRSPHNADLTIEVGYLKLAGWAYVTILGGAGVCLAVVGFYVLSSQDADR
jgi:hypothetical protein